MYQLRSKTAGGDLNFLNGYHYTITIIKKYFMLWSSQREHNFYDRGLVTRVILWLLTKTLYNLVFFILNWCENRLFF